MLTLLKFQNALEHLLPLSQQKTYLLAVSGGVDSMVLATLFQTLGIKFQIAHINYHLRNEDSNQDQKLVCDFCEMHNVPFHLYEVSDKDNKPSQSIQNWARELRYDFFRKIQAEQNLEFLVTAHHLNDQLETFIINLSKAAGIKGLSGIPKNDNQIIRPLLSFSKEEIYAFAEENSVNFREDVSNQKSDYLRNKIRHQVVPELMKTNVDFLTNFEKSIEIINQTKDVIFDLIDEKLDLMSKVNHLGQTVIDKIKLARERKLIQFEVLKRFGFNDEYEMQKIFSAQTGSTFQTTDYLLVVNRNELIFQKMSQHLVSQELEIELEINENKIIIPENIKAEIQQFGNCEWNIDLTKIKLPLKLRFKKSGDLFFPIGMIGKKKLSKFFKDEKLSILAKDKMWLLCDAEEQILGVLPLRQDRRSYSENSEGIKLKI